MQIKGVLRTPFNWMTASPVTRLRAFLFSVTVERFGALFLHALFSRTLAPLDNLAPYTVEGLSQPGAGTFAVGLQSHLIKGHPFATLKRRQRLRHALRDKRPLCISIGEIQNAGKDAFPTISSLPRGRKESYILAEEGGKHEPVKGIP